MNQKPRNEVPGATDTPEPEPGERISGEYRMTYREVARITTVRRSVPAKGRLSEPSLAPVDPPEDKS